MPESLITNYDLLTSRIHKTEGELTFQDDLYPEYLPYKYIVNVFHPEVLSLTTPISDPAKIHYNHPIKWEDIQKNYDNLKWDFRQLYGLTNGFTKSYAQVISNVEEKYLYRGTKLLNPSFQLGFMNARYSHRLFSFDNFQNSEKTGLDAAFFVDRSLGFVTKSITAMEYITPNVSFLTTPFRQVSSSYGYYPNSDTETRYEIFLQMDYAYLMNFLSVDFEFPGDQYLDEIEYIAYSTDGIQYTVVNPYLLYFTNISFRTIYDQNTFKGLIPLHPMKARYIRIGLKLKNSEDSMTVNSIKCVRASFSDALQSIKLPILENAPYIADYEVAASIYIPWDFNYFGNGLIFEPNNSVTFNFSMGVSQNSSETQSNINTYLKYSSPILFDYSVLIGF